MYFQKTKHISSTIRDEVLLELDRSSAQEKVRSLLNKSDEITKKVC